MRPAAEAASAGGGQDAARRVLTVLAARRPGPAGLAALAVGVLAFAVYAATAIRGVSFGDWAEAQVVPAVLGIMHPTGYPTYTLLGALVSVIPIGSAAFKANLLSGACTAAALGTLTLVMTRLGVRPIVAGLTALALGFTADIWLNSIHAEVHTLHLLFVALLLHRLLVWAQGQRPRDLWLGGLLLGLSFGNHMLTLTLAPEIVLGALWLGRRTILAQPRILLPAVFEFLVGLSVYLYLPLRSLDKPSVMYADLSNLGALITHVSGSQFTDQSTALTADGPARFYAQIQTWLAPPGGYVAILAVALAVFGLALVWRTHRAYAVVLLAVFLIGAYLDNNEDPGRRDQYLFTSAAVMTLVIGVAAEAFAARAERAWSGTRALEAVRGLAIGLIALAPLLLYVDTVPTADQSVNDQGQEFVDAVLADLPQGAVLFDLWDVRTAIEYAQQVEGRRKDVTLTESAGKALAYAAAGRPVYVLQVFDAGVEQMRAHYQLTVVDDLYVPYGGISAPYLRPLYRVDVPSAAAPPTPRL
ncbi:MAG TPA: DUF2723 domain-containing protein [Candidatus Sulfotelmatobacter sp.]|nr:DUF2723 domain-containing protein [Candidatus Sulfotelmatobacter sp.]